jgi:2-polyprenyl-3-methyl-5-hydroxy-6-metoxy-1,4-benzoquinol methylase
MYYDPIKDIFAATIKKFPFLTALFYKILNIMFLRSWYVRRELKNLRKVFSNKEISIYDAGTGYGQYSFFMSKQLAPCNVYAVDVKKDWIKNCKIFFSERKINNVSFGIEDLTQITHNNKFDLILCVDVMEHIEDDIKVFHNYYQALRKDGFLIINTPSIYGGSDAREEEDESFIGEHARTGYSFEDLESKLKPIGFSIYQKKYTYGFLGDKAWRLGIKFPMIMVNMSKLFFLILPLYYLLTLPFTFFMMYVDYSGKNKIGSGVNLIAKKEK